VTERRLLSHYLLAATQAHHTLYPGHLLAPETGDREAVEPVSFAEPNLAKRWFDRERTNLTAAIRQGAHHGHHDLVWHLVDPVATFFDRHGYYDDSRSVRELAVVSARAAGHRDAEASSLIGLGMVQMILGDHGSAQDNLTAALRIVETTGNKRGQGSALHQLARLQLQRGEPSEAAALYRRCLEVNHELGDTEGLTWTHCRIGGALRLLDQHGPALQHLYQGQFHAQQIGDDAALASCLAEVAAVYRDRGDFDSAALFCEQALETLESMPITDLAIEVQACLALAEVNTERGEYDAAVRYLDRVDRVTDRTHSAADQARSCDLRADIHFARGEPQEAARSWRRAVCLYDNAGNPVRAGAIGRKLDRLPMGSSALPEARRSRHHPIETTDRRVWPPGT